MLLEKNSFKFGEFLLDTKEKVLFRNGKPLAITPKAFQLLSFLVENHGRLLEKDELIKAIWADSFVEEVNLPFTVSVLRKILEDDKHSPRFIETVSRRGYRFIAEVKEINHDQPQTFVKPKSFEFRKIVIATVAVLIFTLIILGFWIVRSNNYETTAPILAASFNAEKFSTSGKVGHAAISPDGKFVAFVDEIGGKNSIWLKKLETSENVEIIPPGDEVYVGIIFSNDGQTIFFVRVPIEQKSRANIYRVSVSGGIPEKIIETTEGWLSLSPNGKQISFVRCSYQNNDYCSLMIADIDGQNEQKLVTRLAPIRIGDNQFSPDGKSIAFASGNSANGGKDYRLLKFDLTNRTEAEISAERFFNIKNLKWLPDGNNLLIAALDQLDGKAKIRQVSAVTGKVEILTNDASNYLQISLNKNADRLIAIEVKNNFQLYISENNAVKPLIAARYVAFTPDGKVIFTPDDNDLWIIERNGNQKRQLTNNSFTDFSPVSSPDGKYFYFASNRTGANQVWRMNSDGLNEIQITKNEGGYPRSVSPDGKWIYYESGLHQTLWRVASDGSQETEVYQQKLYRPRISPNGNLAAFFFRDKEQDNQTKINVMTVADQRIIKTLDFAEGKSFPVEIDWAKDNQTLYYITFYGSKNYLWAQSLNEEKPRHIADLGDKEIGHFSFSPVGNSFAYTHGEWLHDVVLLRGLK